jgi:hypothetical protein
LREHKKVLNYASIRYLGQLVNIDNRLFYDTVSTAETERHGPLGTPAPYSEDTGKTH